MKVKYLALWISASLMTSMASCSSDNDSEPDGTKQEQNENNHEDNPEADQFSPYTVIQLSNDALTAVKLNNDFAFKLFNKSVESNENIVMSPFSVFSTLGMLGFGDDGQCRDEILTLIAGNPDDANLNKVAEYAQTMIQTLPNVDQNSKCFINNSLWHTDGYEFKPGLTSMLSEFYSTEFFYINSASGSASSSINNWIEDKTEGYMKDFLDPGTDIKAAAVNAIFLKSGWLNGKFNEELTADEPFTNADRTQATVRMMHRTGMFSYMSDGRFRGIEMMLGNGNFSITLVMPDSPDDNATIDAATFMSLLKSGRLCDTKLGLPKFKTDCKDDILMTLRALGLNKTFDVGLNSMLQNNELFRMSIFMHGASMTVDEEGIVGAAASVAGILSDPGDETEPEIVELTFNRPFIYVVRETSTNTILMIGRQSHF